MGLSACPASIDLYHLSRPLEGGFLTTLTTVTPQWPTGCVQAGATRPVPRTAIVNYAPNCSDDESLEQAKWADLHVKIREGDESGLALDRVFERILAELCD
jgi:hypothetical protein